MGEQPARGHGILGTTSENKDVQTLIDSDKNIRFNAARQQLFNCHQEVIFSGISIRFARFWVGGKTEPVKDSLFLVLRSYFRG